MQNGGGDTERKALKGTQPLWAVRLPQPATGAVTCSFDPDAVFLDSAESLALTVVRPDDTVDGIGDHRDELTKAAGGLATGRRGVAGTRYGPAFLITQDGGEPFPIVVENIRDGKVILAEPLPREVEIDSSNTATIRYATYTGTLPAAVSATATGTHPMRWAVSYSIDAGEDLPAHLSETIGGMLHVRERLFGTGLDHFGYMELARSFGGPFAVPGRQQSWMPQIAAAKLSLVSWIRGAATESLSTNREDDLDGGAFRLAHAYFTAAMATRSPEERAGLIADGEREAKRALDSLIRIDNTSKEPVVEDHGRRSSLLAGGSGSNSTFTKTDQPFYIGKPA